MPPTCSRPCRRNGPTNPSSPGSRSGWPGGMRPGRTRRGARPAAPLPSWPQQTPKRPYGRPRRRSPGWPTPRRRPPCTLSQTGQEAATASSRSSTRTASCAVNPSRPLLRARRGSGSRGPAVRLSGTTEFPMPPRPLRHPGRTKRGPGSRGWGETRAGPHGARDAETALDVIQGPLALKNAQALGNAADLEDPWFPSCDVRFGIQGSSTPRSKRQGVLHPVSSVDRTNTATGIEAAPRVFGR